MRRGASDEFDSLHESLLLDSDDARSRDLVARTLLPLVRQHLRKRFARCDLADIDSAVNDALVAYIRNPSMCDIGRGPLMPFLCRCAANRLIDQLRVIKRRCRVEVVSGLLIESPTAAYDRPVEDLIETEVTGYRGSDEWLSACARTAEERAFLTARLSGERRTAVLARILVGSDSSCDMSSRRVLVHRTWARLRARLRALAVGHSS